MRSAAFGETGPCFYVCIQVTVFESTGSLQIYFCSHRSLHSRTFPSVDDIGGQTFDMLRYADGSSSPACSDGRDLTNDFNESEIKSQR